MDFGIKLMFGELVLIVCFFHSQKAFCQYLIYSGNI